MRLPVSTFGLAQQLLCFIQFLLKCKCSQTHWHIKQSFSKSQYPDEASADWWAKREIHSAQKIQHSSLMFAPTTKKIVDFSSPEIFRLEVEVLMSVRWAQALQKLLGSTHRWIVRMLTLSSHYWSHIQMPLHISVANCRLTVLLVPRISCAILGSQNALIKVGEVLRLWPAVIAILPSLEPQQLSNISHN